MLAVLIIFGYLVVGMLVVLGIASMIVWVHRGRQRELGITPVHTFKEEVMDELDSDFSFLIWMGGFFWPLIIPCAILYGLLSLVWDFMVWLLFDAGRS